MNASYRTITVLGLLLVVGSGVWLGWLMLDPKLTYSIIRDETVTLTCGSIHNEANDGEVVNTFEVLDGTVQVDEGDGLGSLYGPDNDNPDEVLEITRAQVTGDCATARAQRAAWTWLPKLGVVLGASMVWGSTGPRRPRPAVRPPADPRLPTGPPPTAAPPPGYPPTQ